jgi:Flp pilus assembly protein TadD
LAALGRHAEAEEAYREALRFEPDNPTVHSKLGKLLDEQARHNEADAELNESIRLEPENGKHWAHRGWVGAHRGEWEKALSDFDKAIEVSPKDAALHNDLARELAAQPSPDGRGAGSALKWAKKAVEFEPKEGSYWKTLGIALYREAEWNASVLALNESMSLRNGGDSSDWLFLAMCHAKLGEKEKARAWYNKAAERLTRSPTSNDALRRFRKETEDLLGL